MSGPTDVLLRPSELLQITFTTQNLFYLKEHYDPDPQYIHKPSICLQYEKQPPEVFYDKRCS